MKPWAVPRVPQWHHHHSLGPLYNYQEHLPMTDSRLQVHGANWRINSLLSRINHVDWLNWREQYYVSLPLYRLTNHCLVMAREGGSLQWGIQTRFQAVHFLHSQINYEESFINKTISQLQYTWSGWRKQLTAHWQTWAWKKLEFNFLWAAFTRLPLA